MNTESVPIFMTNTLSKMTKISAIVVVLELVVAIPAFSQPALTVLGPPTQVTAEDSQYLMQPRWAPDSQTLLVTESNYKGLWVVDQDGSLLQVTEEPSAGFGASWSPDGNSILSRVSRFEHLRRYDAVKIFEVGTTTETTISDYSTINVRIPNWVSEGDVLWHDGQQFRLFSVTGSTASVESQSLLVSTENSVVRLSLSNLHLVSRIRQAEGKILNLVPSPDGSMVAFEVMGGNMFVMNADGSNEVDLGRGNRPRWSPDSNWLVYSISEDDGHNFVSSDLFAVRPDGGQKTQLTETPLALEMNPDWSPDGRLIAFDDRGRVYSLRVNY